MLHSPHLNPGRVMADIFLSYSKEDRARAASLAAALTEEGWDVFWDRTIPTGKTWRDWIGGKLSDAKCMVVLWSDSSIKSRWVLEEAEIGVQRNMLIPASVDPVPPPLGFGAIQSADLSNWSGSRDAPEFQELCRAVQDLAGSPSASATVETPTRVPQTTKTTPAPAPIAAALQEPTKNTPQPAPIWQSTTDRQTPAKSTNSAPGWLWALYLAGLACYAAFTWILYASPGPDQQSSYYFAAVLAVLVAGTAVSAAKPVRMYWVCMAGACAQIIALAFALLNGIGDAEIVVPVFFGIAAIMAVLGLFFQKYSKRR